MIRIAIAAAALFIPAAPDAAFDAQRAAWNRTTAPFRIIGNVHYVGTAELAAYLITDPKGHVLIDGAMSESVPQIAANIRRLGYRVEDVRHLLINHAHWDHADGVAGLKAMSGATLLASAADTPTLETGIPTDRDDVARFAAVKVDRRIGDGAVVQVGATRIVARLTPGHTPGCTSFTLATRDRAVRGGKPVNIIFACSLTVAGQQLVGNPRYPGAAADFRATFAKLGAMKADVFLNFHSGFFRLVEKRERQLSGDAAAFVDPGELGRQVAAARTAFEAELVKQRGGGA